MEIALTASSSAKFVRCDVLSWDEQLDMFKDALANSPSQRIDIVCANAGVAIPDSAFNTDPQQEHPDKPSLKVLDINGGRTAIHDEASTALLS